MTTLQATTPLLPIARSSPAPLSSTLRRLGQRLMAVGVSAAIGWGLALALVVLLAGTWLDLLWELAPEVRVGCLVAAAVTAMGLVAYLGWRTLRRRTPGLLARRLDHVAGSGGRILSGVDLSLEEHRQSALTSGLSELAVADAARLAERVPGSRAVPLRPLGWSLGGLAALIAVVALIVLLLPRLAWTQWLRFTDPYGDHVPFSRVVYHVQPGDVQVIYGSGFDVRVTTEGPPVERVDLVLQTSPPERPSPTRRGEGGEVSGEETVPMFPEPSGEWRATVAGVTAPGHYHVRSHAGRSDRFRIDVITVPKIEGVRFRITPPAYTNQPAYEGPAPQGGLAGLRGTKVEVRAKSNRPLSESVMEITGADEKAALKPTSPQSHEVTGSFEIRAAGKLALGVTDVNGQPSSDKYSVPIVLLTDERPFIRLVEPREVSFATPNAVLPVVLSAEDDYGIGRIQLFRSLNDSRAVPTDTPVKKPPPTRWSETHVLPLSDYGLAAGDEIKLFARVEDNDPAGPKGAESTVVVVRIISQEDFDRMVRTREGMEAFLSKYQQAQRRLENLAEAMDRLQKEIDKQPADSELAQEMKNELQQLAEQAKKEADAIRESAKHPLPYDLDKELSKHLDKLAEQMEEAA